MAKVGISTGSAANAGDGSTLRDGGNIINANFTEIYDYFGDGTNLTYTGGKWVSVSAGINTLSNVGIATTNPLTPLQVEQIYGVKTGIGTFNASAGVSTDFDSFDTTSLNFQTAEYTVNVGFGTHIQSQKVLVMQNGTSAYSQEYAVMFNPSLVVSIGATMTGTTCKLQATPETGITGLTTFRFVRSTLL